ncbi:MAG TPA: M23 family metallopeptidase, partial [Thermoanaerobaculia bacterium]|nr:M23 family metallopeptidase [Thermoanaerobaculia bacterium]
HPVRRSRNSALQLSRTRVVEALMLARLLLAAIRITVEPRPAYIEQSATSQFVNFDLIVESSTDEPLVLRKFVDGNGSRPSIRTVDVAEIPAKGTVLLFNPFHQFDRDLDLHAMKFDLKFSSKDGERRFDANVTVEPRPHVTKAPLILPLKGAMIVYDGHDFYAHHRRWDYTIPMLRQLGFKTNFMRYSYDFVPVNADGAMSAGDAQKNENWFGFGREIRAAADGVVAALVDDQPADRRFDPSSIAEHGTMRVFGNYVVIDHGNGEFGLYGHIRQSSARVKVGQRVKCGDVVAAIGASGSSMFPHLHFELQTGVGTDSEGLPSSFRDFVRVQGAKRVSVRSGIVESGEIIESTR